MKDPTTESVPVIIRMIFAVYEEICLNLKIQNIINAMRKAGMDNTSEAIHTIPTKVTISLNFTPALFSSINKNKITKMKEEMVTANNQKRHG